MAILRIYNTIQMKRQEAIFGNTTRMMGDAPMKIDILLQSNCMKADPTYGKGVANALKILLSGIPR